MLQNEYSLPKLGADEAETGPESANDLKRIGEKETTFAECGKFQIDFPEPRAVQVRMELIFAGYDGPECKRRTPKPKKGTQNYHLL